MMPWDPWDRRVDGSSSAVAVAKRLYFRAALHIIIQQRVHLLAVERVPGGPDRAHVEGQVPAVSCREIGRQL